MEYKIVLSKMACNKCVSNVERALKNINGVRTVQVELSNQTAIVTCTHAISNSTFCKAISDIGFQVVEVSASCK